MIRNIVQLTEAAKHIWTAFLTEFSIMNFANVIKCVPGLYGLAVACSSREQWKCQTQITIQEVFIVRHIETEQLKVKLVTERY
jgi:hypothetical protein